MADNNQNTAIEPKKNVAITRQMLYDNQKQFEEAIGELRRWISPDKLLRVAMTAVQSEWKLMQSDPKTIFASVIQLAQVGLVPDGFLGQAYLIPYKNTRRGGIYEAKPMIGYKGFGELIVRSGKANSHDAHVVYEGDKFDYEYGSTPYISHKPTLAQRGNRLGAYAVVYMKDGPARFELMSAQDIEKVKNDAAKGTDKDDSPWKNWEDSMWRKTPMRRISNWLSLSPEFQMAGQIDELADLGKMKLVNVEGGGAIYVPDNGEQEEEKKTVQQPQRQAPVEVKTQQAAAPVEEKQEAKPEPKAETVQAEVNPFEEKKAEAAPAEGELTYEPIKEKTPSDPFDRDSNPQGKHISQPQTKRMYAILRSSQKANDGKPTDEEFNAHVVALGYESPAHLPHGNKEQYDKVVAWAEKDWAKEK